jgi:L-seryl-tRNA(Ser) seleniumtransferase
MDASERVNARLRQIPGVDRLMTKAGQGCTYAPWSLVDRTRARAAELEQVAPRRVLNATGVVLHTNLGRSPLAPEAAAAAMEAARAYTDLELDLESGERGSRTSRLETLLLALTGAEAAHVVNNNAAALLLAVDTLAAKREVVLSRGELVEIGGSFRVPEIMAASRAQLREVGTTNRTHLEDYRRALGLETGLLLKVHRSNFEIRGFTSEVGLPELAGLGRAHSVPVVEDRGSGTFLDLRPLGIPEPEAHAGLREGADLVLFSGDKLLGGPQAGILLGRRELVERLKRNPLARALRVDKMTIAALHWTLRSMLDGTARDRIPVLRMILRSGRELQDLAEQLAGALRGVGLSKVSVEPIPSRVGGGALPDVELPGFGVRVETQGSVDALALRLRQGEPPVLARVHRDGLLLDPRALSAESISEVAAAFAALEAEKTPSGTGGSR